MAQLAGLLSAHDQMVRRGGAMGVVALPTIPQDVGRVLVGLDERGLAVTGEAASLGAETSPPAHRVTLLAVDGERGMQAEGSEALGRSLSHEKADLTASALPDQRQRVLAGAGVNLAWKTSGKGSWAGRT